MSASAIRVLGLDRQALMSRAMTRCRGEWQHCMVSAPAVRDLSLANFLPFYDKDLGRQETSRQWWAC